MLAKASINGYKSYYIDFSSEYKELIENINNVSNNLPDLNIKQAVSHIRSVMEGPELWYVSYFSPEIQRMLKYPIILSPNEVSEKFVYAFIHDKNLTFNRVGTLPTRTYYEVYDNFVIEKYIDRFYNHMKVCKIIDNIERFK